MKPRFSACAIRKTGSYLTEMGEKSSNNTVQERMSSWTPGMGISPWLCPSTVPIRGLVARLLSLHVFFSIPSSRVPTADHKLLNLNLQDPRFILCPNEQFSPSHVMKKLKKASSGTNWLQEMLEFYFKFTARGWDLWTRQTKLFSLEKYLWKRRKVKGKKRNMRRRKECKGQRRRPYKKEIKEDDE